MYLIYIIENVNVGTRRLECKVRIELTVKRVHDPKEERVHREGQWNDE